MRFGSLEMKTRFLSQTEQLVFTLDTEDFSTIQPKLPSKKHGRNPGTIQKQILKANIK